MLRAASISPSTTQIPVRIERVDDTSDVGTAVQLVQQLLARDDIHFIFPPWGTASNFAIAQDISDVQSPVIGCTVGSRDLVESASDYPYFYTMLNQAHDQGRGWSSSSRTWAWERLP
jgi:branched-chain amino acid transport system substrate-binding protein